VRNAHCSIWRGRRSKTRYMELPCGPSRHLQHSRPTNSEPSVPLSRLDSLLFAAPWDTDPTLFGWNSSAMWWFRMSPHRKGSARLSLLGLSSAPAEAKYLDAVFLPRSLDSIARLLHLFPKPGAGIGCCKCCRAVITLDPFCVLEGSSGHKRRFRGGYMAPVVGKLMRQAIPRDLTWPDTRTQPDSRAGLGETGRRFSGTSAVPNSQLTQCQASECRASTRETGLMQQ